MIGACIAQCVFRQVMPLLGLMNALQNVTVVVHLSLRSRCIHRLHHLTLFPIGQQNDVFFACTHVILFQEFVSRNLFMFSLERS